MDVGEADGDLSSDDLENNICAFADHLLRHFFCRVSSYIYMYIYLSLSLSLLMLATCFTTASEGIVWPGFTVPDSMASACAVLVTACGLQTRKFHSAISIRGCAQ